jgi:hypothetical protein
MTGEHLKEFSSYHINSTWSIEGPVWRVISHGLRLAVGVLILQNMTLKNAALFALVGMLLLTVLVVAGFISDVLNVSQGLIPMTKVLSSLVYSLAALSVTLFFYVFHKAQ